MSTTARTTAAVLVIVLAGACKPKAVVQAPPVPSVSMEGLPRSGASQTGLELLTWHVQESPELDEMLETHAGVAFETTDQEHLERNAMMLLKTEEAALGALLEDLGGINASMSAWCGQVIDWQDLRDIRFKSHVLLIDGKRTIFDGGRFGIATRAWVEPTIAGARMHVEFVPRFQEERGPYSSLLVRERPKSRFIEQLAKNIDLKPGEVLMLTCCGRPPAPAPPPPFVGPPIGEDPDPDDDPTLDTRIPTPNTRPVRFDKIGHALFELPGESPERIILVLVPRVPPTMLPQTTTPRERRASADVESSP